MAESYRYRFVDPEALDTSDIGLIPGSNADCLRDSLLDIVHIALDSGMTMDDVDAALAEVVDHVAGLNRRFKIHRRSSAT